MSAQPTPRLSAEQYLEIERTDQVKHDFFDGRMYSMAGASYAHSILTANLIGLLFQALENSPCRVGSTDLRVRASAEGLYTYPDVLVVCGEPKLADARHDTLLNPTLIVEVLSKSTEAYHRGLKFAEYRRIDSLREYVLVSQTDPHIEVFTREAGGEWTLRDFAGMDAECRFNSIDTPLALARIYRNVPLGDAAI